MQVKRGNTTLVHDDKKRGGGKRRRKRKPRGKNPIRRRVGVYTAAASQLYRDVRWLMSVVNVEDKYIDTSGGVTYGNTWTYILINAIAQGTTPNTRIGQSVKCVGIELRCTTYVAAASTVPQNVRIMCFIDKQPNAAAPGATDVYPNNVLAPRTVGYIDRFSILFERTFALNTVSTANVAFDYIARQDWHEEFNLLNNGTIADITKNALYMGYITDQSVNLPNLGYYARYVYVDN